MDSSSYGKSFEPEVLNTLNRAFESAWAHFEAKGDLRTLKAVRDQFRLKLAKKIFELAPVEPASADELALNTLKTLSHPSEWKVTPGFAPSEAVNCAS